MSHYSTIDSPPTALDSNGLPYRRLDAPLAAFGGRNANAIDELGDLLQQGIARFGDRAVGPAQDFRGQMLQQRSLAHESAANDAMNKYRLDAMQTHGDYSGQRLQDAVNGYDAYRQTLQASRDNALTGLSSAAQALLRPHLERAHDEGLQLGQQHRLRQDQAWSDQSSLDTLAANQQEAVLRRDDPLRVQALADHGIGEWIKIGERKGWSDQQIGQAAAQAKAQLFGAVIQAHLHDGNVQQARVALDQAQGQVDRATMQKLIQNIQAPGQTSPYDNANPQLGGNRGEGFLKINSADGPQLAQGNPPVSNGSILPGPNTLAPSSSDDSSSALDTAGKRGTAPPTDPIISGMDPELPSDRPVLYRDYDRRQSILKGTPAKIILLDNPNADSGKPLYEEHYPGKEAVDKYDAPIRSEAEQAGIDPDLVRAIIYMEESHGNYYGASDILEKHGWAKSLMPMNIRPNFWGSLAPDHPDLKDAKANIHAGIALLKGIMERLDSPTIEKIATLYNSMSADRVSGYGKRVAAIMKEKPWLGPPRNPSRLPAGVQMFPPFGQ